MSIRHAEPIPIKVDNIVVAHWPSKDPEDVLTHAVEMLHGAYLAYIQARPFLNFAEGPQDRLRRIATALVQGKVPAEHVLVAYLRRYGVPDDGQEFDR